MRAADILAGRDTGMIANMAARYNAEATSQSILEAMRSPRVFSTLRSQCTSTMMVEDLIMICANPFDPVGADELVEPGLFVELGVISPIDETGREFGVNLDIAVASAPSIPIEYGYVATLCARLHHDDLKSLSRKVGIGPRPSNVELVIDTANAILDRDQVLRRLARLAESDREVLRDAIENGELPDEVQGIGAIESVPRIVTDRSLGGHFGMMYWFEHREIGIPHRAVVPFEMVYELPGMMDEVPPAPETQPRKKTPVRRATTRNSGSSKPATKPKPKTLSEDLLPGMLGAGEPEVEAQPVHEPARIRTNADQKGTRLVEVFEASTLVDLETSRRLDMIMEDDELSAAVVNQFGDAQVLLKTGIDAQDWLERCALRLSAR